MILGKVCRSLANFTGFTIPRHLRFAHVDENQPSRALIPRVYLGRTSAQALREGTYKTPGFPHALHNARLIEAVMHSADRGVRQKVRASQTAVPSGLD